MPRIILASSSVYRRQLLDKLQLTYQCISPEIDETPLADESAKVLAKRLAKEKAEKIANAVSDSLVIGSDQTAALDQHILGKPGTRKKAIEQLLACSGQTVTFWTGLAVINSETKRSQSIVVPFTVHFRELTQQQIENYIDKEQPLDCAGSFKCEGLGIALFEKLSGNDPNSLIGLPLIELVSMLKKEGINII